MQKEASHLEARKISGKLQQPYLWLFRERKPPCTRPPTYPPPHTHTLLTASKKSQQEVRVPGGFSFLKKKSQGFRKTPREKSLCHFSQWLRSAVCKWLWLWPPTVKGDACVLWLGSLASRLCAELVTFLIFQDKISVRSSWAGGGGINSGSGFQRSLGHLVCKACHWGWLGLGQQELMVAPLSYTTKPGPPNRQLRLGRGWYNLQMPKSSNHFCHQTLPPRGPTVSKLCHMLENKHGKQDIANLIFQVQTMTPAAQLCWYIALFVKWARKIETVKG